MAPARPGLDTTVGEDYARRHRLLLIVLWGQIPAIALLGLVRGTSPAVIGLISLLLLPSAVVGSLSRRHRAASAAVGLGLVAAGGLFVILVESPAALLYLAAMVAATSLYRIGSTLALATLASVAFVSIDLLATGDVYGVALQAGLLVALALIFAVGWELTTVGGIRQPGEGRYRLGFEAAPIGMAILKPSGVLLEVNQAMGRLIDMEPTALVGRNIRALVHSDDRVELGLAWEEMGNGLTHRSTASLRLVSSRGAEIWCRLSLSLVPRTSASPAAVILQAEDMTSGRREQRRLEDLIETRDEYLAAIADEIREPLHDLLDLVATDRADQGAIAEQANRAAAMVEDLAIAANDAGRRLNVLALPLDAATLCHEVVASTPGTDHVEVSAEAGSICADPALTRQILHGLVANSLNYGGASMRVESLSSGPDTLIRVIDDGPGVPEPDRHLMFESGLTGGRSRTRPASVGLRMTVGRNLARRMGGDLVYRRTEEDENVYELRLPSEPVAATYVGGDGELGMSA